MKMLPEMGNEIVGFNGTIFDIFSFMKNKTVCIRTAAVFHHYFAF